MRQKWYQRYFRTSRKSIVTLFVGLGILGLLLVACGGGSSASIATNSAVRSNASGNAKSQGVAVKPQATQPGSSAGQTGPQYLVKSLQVTMEVQNPLQAASELQKWVAFSAPQSTSNGSDYESMGNGQYTVNLNFLVDVDHYTQVEAYLRDYASQKGRTLDSLRETVQDVTNDYIDTQSTLANLRAEQQRLLSFMNQAQNVNDAVNIEQQLAQVEGQINSIEAHLNALKGQTTYYNIALTIQPVGSVPPAPGPWSVVPVWQGAWSAVAVVWQALVSILVWLLAFSVYIVPAGILIWLIRKRPWKSQLIPQVKPVLATSAPIVTPPEPSQTTETAI